ncbi:hypothetical protein LEMLEM_LOCUS19482 [Lemmus lemmus]
MKMVAVSLGGPHSTASTLAKELYSSDRRGMHEQQFNKTDEKIREVQEEGAPRQVLEVLEVTKV